ncbi:flagellar biosynthesis anti-sigma factor FlgM [Kosakonia sp. BK9b]|uniref:flagellar biosynthesis anti-sigma factor FlgM n=1 Tax=Kosakonia sp. TaxID=1916651 RepID=UPI0028A289DB|nr:flagellar biosynthesis anti-sigma factor FlgM [Kosakonia sp.]
MSIDRTSPLKPVSTVQQRETSETQTQKTRQEKAAATNSTNVTISGAQAKLMQADAKDINMERVEQLKAQIRNGELKMDTGKIADALIDEAKSYLQGK